MDYMSTTFVNNLQVRVCRVLKLLRMWSNF